MATATIVGFSLSLYVIVSAEILRLNHAINMSTLCCYVSQSAVLDNPAARSRDSQ